MFFRYNILLFFLVIAISACKNTKPNSSDNENPSHDSLNNLPHTEVVEDRPSPLKRTTGSIDDIAISIQYGSPSVKGRKIWGTLVPYNEVWRTGANEATVIEFSKDILVDNQELKAGKYGFFTIPAEEEWVLIFNSVWDQWGAYDYDTNLDVLRIKAKPLPHSPMVEQLDFIIHADGVSMVWENLEVGFSVKAK